MRIIVTGGGTGGHLFPGIAFATGMQDRVPGCQVMFIGTSRLLDQQTLIRKKISPQIQSSAPFLDWYEKMFLCLIDQPSLGEDL